jgi:hypothetical protein
VIYLVSMHGQTPLNEQLELAIASRLVMIAPP